MKTTLEIILNFFIAIILPITFNVTMVGVIIWMSYFFTTIIHIYNKEKINHLKHFMIYIFYNVFSAMTLLVFYHMDVFFFNDLMNKYTNIDLFTTKIYTVLLTVYPLTMVNDGITSVTGKSLFKIVIKVISKVKELLTSIKEVKEEAKAIGDNDITNNDHLNA